MVVKLSIVAKVSIVFLLMTSQSLPALAAEESGDKVLCGHVEYKAGQRVAEFETALLNLALP